jgi:hypothetical protein
MHSACVEEKIIEHKMRVLIFSTAFVLNISRSKKSAARYKLTWIFHAKYQLFLSDFNET